MDLDLHDKIVLTTGASGGIGRAMARAFASAGARLALHGNRRSEAQPRRGSKLDGSRP